jgi:hypothetical protein
MHSCASLTHATPGEIGPEAVGSPRPTAEFQLVTEIASRRVSSLQTIPPTVSYSSTKQACIGPVWSSRDDDFRLLEVDSSRLCCLQTVTRCSSDAGCSRCSDPIQTARTNTQALVVLVGHLECLALVSRRIPLD